MKKLILTFVVISGLTMLLAGCSARVSAPETRTDLAWDERIPWDTDSESIYEENLHLFDYDQEAPLDIQELETRRDGNLTVYEITYASPMGGRVPATLIVPDGRGPFAGMILLHGTSSNRQDFFSMGRRYARMGTVVILIDAPFNRPEHGGPDRESITFVAGFIEEHTQLIVDLRRAVDLLIVRPDVDPDRIAYVGVSYGAAAGGLLAGVEDRVQAYGLMVGDGGLVEHFLGPDDVTSYPWSSARVPDYWVEAMWSIESIHYVGHAAPAALLFQNGANDRLVPPPEAALYQQAGSDPKTIVWYDSGHGLPSQADSDQAKWFQQYIGEGRVFVLRPNYRASAPVLDRVLLTWFVLAAASLVFLIRDLWRDTPAPWGARLMWLLVVVLFGPIGLLAYLVSYRQPLRAPDPQAAMTTARRAFGSTTWGVAATIIGMVIGLEVDRLELPLERSNWPLFAFLFYIALPAITGLLVFLLAWVATPRDDRHRFPFRRPLLAAIISANMGVAGGWPVFIIIVNRWSFAALALTDLLFWAVLALGAIVGALVAYPLHIWMVHRGAVRWEAPSLVGEVAAGPEARKPRWFEALAITLLTYVIVIAAILLTLMAVAGLTLEELILWLTGF